MSDKHIENLLDGFVKSSQCLSSLQEGILSLHGVMEQFQHTTGEFSLKNEMDTLLPTVKAHVAQVNDMYGSIGESVATIKADTVLIQATALEMVPAYEKLQVEVGQLQEMQQEMVDTIREVSDSVQAMQVMQQELRLQMAEFREMMMESKLLQEQLLERGKKS